MESSLRQDNRLLKREYFRTLFPVMFSVLGATINALIDSVFVSQRLGEDALAAVNLSMPVYLVLCTFGSLISGGASVCSARDAGKENMKSAQDYYRIAFFFSAAVTVLFTVSGVIFCRPVSTALAGGGALADQVYSYSLVTFIGSGASVFLYLPLSYLQLEGRSKALTVSVIILVAADVVFDLLFLFVFDLGLPGASAASVISSAAAVIYGFAILSGKDSNYHIGWVKITLKKVKAMLKYGSPAALGNLFDAVKLIFLNSIILATLGPKGAAVWAVLNTLSELSLMIVSGVPRAGAPMISAYYTASENGGIRLLTKIEAVTGIAFSVIFAVVTALSHGLIEKIFGVSSDMLFPIICLGLSVILSTLCGIWEKHFNSIGLIAEANIASGARCCLMPIAAAVVLAVSVCRDSCKGCVQFCQRSEGRSRVFVAGGGRKIVGAYVNRVVNKLGYEVIVKNKGSDFFSAHSL